MSINRRQSLQSFVIISATSSNRTNPNDRQTIFIRESCNIAYLCTLHTHTPVKANFAHANTDREKDRGTDREKEKARARAAQATMRGKEQRVEKETQKIDVCVHVCMCKMCSIAATQLICIYRRSLHLNFIDLFSVDIFVFLVH